jgi:hypothetical protein
MAFRRKMHHGGYAVVTQEFGDKRTVFNGSARENIARIIRQGGKVVRVSRVSEGMQVKNLCRARRPRAGDEP